MKTMPGSSESKSRSGWSRFVRQLLRRNPFEGDIVPGRVPLFAPGSGRPTLPFPHPWNYRRPITIMATYFWGVDDAPNTDGSRDNRYLDVPGFPTVLITRDSGVVRAIAADTGDKPGQFDRDTMPTGGIARATGRDTLLYANGELWKRQKRLASSPFSKSSLFQPEQFHEFEASFRVTAQQRLDALRRLSERQTGPARVCLEQEVKAVMLELLVNNFFGADVPYGEIRGCFVPAIERVIDHIVTDTVLHRLGMPLSRLPWLGRSSNALNQAFSDFEELTSKVIATRAEGKGLWGQFKSDAPDDALRGNVRVFLAGALEATTSFACWALSHLARNATAQNQLFEEIGGITDYTPEQLRGARYLGCVLEETLRLTPALYFLPRRATVDRRIETTDGRWLTIPQGTHVLLDIWHANRNESIWGRDATGYPAAAFAPERWLENSPSELRARDLLHFGFGHGPRSCPGQHLGMMEVALVVGAFVKLFRFNAVRGDNPVDAGVSTRPEDHTEVELVLR